ncbi:amino acid ABC transporter substrate-binding protein [Aeromicrobium sp. IC_218]|uniref:amino acid ABC transporter substrate-binding protein n=1 Tax=Aeromicrobium sp. IC_218 TaxID=2545468 RepID=UPI00103C2D67|nr:amino acid ABC transporter substrate-binding protein [Aeromicrobium sp. IC_218]TCJ00746.1 amino acid ABC transporter substrate-binding protein [Aeromicrobium sp. IC_218]
MSQTSGNAPISNRPGEGPAQKRSRTGLVVGVVVALVVVALVVFFLTRDGDDASDEGYQLVDDGVLTVATEGTYRPFTFHEQGGDLVGYDVEVIEAIAKKLDLKIKFQETQFDAIFAGLDGGRFDLIANQISINPEREAKYLMSEPYTISPGVLIVPADNTDIQGFDDLKGRTTAQSLTSNWFEVAKSFGAEVEAVEGWAQSVALIKDGRVDATVNDKLTLLDYQKQQGGDAGLKVVAETDDPSRSAFVVTKDNAELMDDVDDALEELREDGTLAEIGEKYFGQDVSR